MSWFGDVFGFEEESYEATRKNFILETSTDGSHVLIAKLTNQRFEVGTFECPSARELNDRLASLQACSTNSFGGCTFKNIVGDVRSLHRETCNAGAVFQVASQFNALEMVGPKVRPDDGITRYFYDKTQGPACALSCPAATVFRNYFCMPGGRGQRASSQLDMLCDVAKVVDNETHKYWHMQNGYCLPSDNTCMAKLGKQLQDEELAQRARDSLRIAVHWGTPVHGKNHNVAQVFASALPVAYAKGTQSTDWAPFARVVLDGLYDATLAAAAILAHERGERVKVYLTAVGGGAFGNRVGWIVPAIQSALTKHAKQPLDVQLVHYGTLPRDAFTGLCVPKCAA